MKAKEENEKKRRESNAAAEFKEELCDKSEVCGDTASAESAPSVAVVGERGVCIDEDDVSLSSQSCVDMGSEREGEGLEVATGDVGSKNEATDSASSSEDEMPPSHSHPRKEVIMDRLIKRQLEAEKWHFDSDHPRDGSVNSSSYCESRETTVSSLDMNTTVLNAANSPVMRSPSVQSPPVLVTRSEEMKGRRKARRLSTLFDC